MKLKYGRYKLLGLFIFFGSVLAGDVEYASSTDIDDLSEDGCDFDTNINLLNQLFMTETIDVLRSRPDDISALDLLYLANEIAEDYIRDGHPEINCKDLDYLSKVIAAAKIVAQETLLAREAAQKEHREKMKRFIIKSYCEFRGWPCPKFK